MMQSRAGSRVHRTGRAVGLDPITGLYTHRRAPAHLHSGRGLGSFSSWLCSSGILSPTSATCSESAADANITPPTIGLPVGYDPTTGLVAPTNTTGATFINPAIVDYPAGGGPPAPAGSSFLCAALGIGCGGAGAPSSPGSIPGWAWGVGITLAAIVLLGTLKR